MTVQVPVGTLVSEYIPDQKKLGKLIIDLDKPDMEFVIAKGGHGGRGNSEFSSAIRRTPLIKETGKPGELKSVHLELKILADIGLVVKQPPFLTAVTENIFRDFPMQEKAHY
jgi:GTP-binding protein